MISFRQFNKSKKNSVLLIHGLFSSSGFWLEYLQYFKDLRVVLCDIDYEEFFDNPKYFYKIISDHIHANHINKTIAHSFGSSINLSIPNDIMKINICPTHFKSRTNKTNFIDDIYLKTKLDKEKINKLLIKADKFYKKNQILFKKDKSYTTNFIPTNDSFFTYNDNSNFAGDHFNIDNAVKKILKLNEFIK